MAPLDFALLAGDRPPWSRDRAVSCLLLFQGSALVSRAQPGCDRLAVSVDAALDALRPR